MRDMPQGAEQLIEHVPIATILGLAALLVVSVVVFCRLVHCHRLLREAAGGLEKQSNAVEQLEALNDRTSDELKREREAARDVISRIEGIIAERDSWQRLYYEQAAAHGNAESMLWEERRRLIIQLRRAGQKPATSAQIEEVLAAFEGRHAAPARKWLGQPQNTAIGNSGESETEEANRAQG